MKSFKFFIVFMIGTLLFCVIAVALAAWYPNVLRAIAFFSFGVFFSEKMARLSAWIVKTKKEE